MFTLQRVTFDELADRLRDYERKYGWSTIEFFGGFEAGELGDDDDLLMWAGLYHLYLTTHPSHQIKQHSPGENRGTTAGIVGVTPSVMRMFPAATRN